MPNEGEHSKHNTEMCTCNSSLSTVAHTDNTNFILFTIPKTTTNTKDNQPVRGQGEDGWGSWGREMEELQFKRHE